VALGFYRDWFHLTVNQDKMKGDTEAAKETADQSKGARTATGRVKKVEAADSRFLMTTGDNEELTMYTGPSSKLRRNDREVKLEQLQAQDEVEVGYDRKDGKNLAASVTVHRE
jgi:Cu/Ag efflux protein CusF